MKNLQKSILFILISFFVISCSTENNTQPVIPQNNSKDLTIFHINDSHGSIENFAKIKYIVDQEKKETNVLLVCAGDIFSGNPVVDNYNPKGYPMIDLMNKVGFDISEIGNHEFDYGETILKDRFLQSQFSWICANVAMNNTGIPQPKAYQTITKDNIKITFLGLVETNGKEGAVIPSTHPWRVKDLTFQKYTDVIGNYAQVKQTENADLYIALTHLGLNTDKSIANNYPYFDMIIGGHSHSKAITSVNNIPIFQAGSKLNYLGKINLTLKDKKIESLTYDLIDLNSYPNYDAAIKNMADNYNQEANLDEVIGYSSAYHDHSQVGYFYTDILKKEMNADITFQNTGGIRNSLDEGDITKREIFEIDPFNNGAVTYTMTVSEIKNFLKGSKIAVYYAGVKIEEVNNEVVIKNLNDEIINDNTTLTVGLNDYIPAVYDTYFTKNPMPTNFTTAEEIIDYLENHTSTINYTSYNNYFKFQ